MTTPTIAPVERPPAAAVADVAASLEGVAIVIEGPAVGILEGTAVGMDVSATDGDGIGIAEGVVGYTVG